MESKYVVELCEHFDGFVLYEQINGVLTQVAISRTQYAIDKVVANYIKDIIRKNTPFMKSEGRMFYYVSNELGDMLKIHIKVFDLLPTLNEKLLYIDRIQPFTLLAEGNYKLLKERLNVYYLVKKVEGNQEEV